MSKLRPECTTAPPHSIALSNETAFWLIRNSVAKRRSLIHGRLHDGKGGHCAMGAFWTDNPKAIVLETVTDEVAAVNDSFVNVTPHERWKKVNSWLRFKIAALAGKKIPPDTTETTQ